VLFFQKDPQPPAEYTILMSQAKRLGHDDRGNPMYRQGPDFPLDERDDDLEYVDQQLARLKAGHDDESQFGFRVGRSDLENNVLIPR
jgi:hypothetical protein